VGPPPGADEEGPTVTIYSEEMLLLLSLVSEECSHKAEQHLAAQRLERALTSEERRVWVSKREELRRQLKAAGKLRD
jgi:hypothetical protein